MNTQHSMHTVLSFKLSSIGWEMEHSKRPNCPKIISHIFPKFCWKTIFLSISAPWTATKTVLYRNNEQFHVQFFNVLVFIMAMSVYGHKQETQTVWQKIHSWCSRWSYQAISSIQHFFYIYFDVYDT